MSVGVMSAGATSTGERRSCASAATERDARAQRLVWWTALAAALAFASPSHAQTQDADDATPADDAPVDAAPADDAAPAEAPPVDDSTPDEPTPDEPASDEAPQEELQASALSKLPVQTVFVDAEYPEAAREQGIETDVILLLDINEEGFVDSVAIAAPVDPPGMGFEEAAITAALDFEFEPAEMDDTPIAVQIQYRYRFNLTPEEPGAVAAAAGDEADADADAAEAGETAPDAPAEAAPEPPAREPLVNFSGKLRERGTRLPLAGVMVTVFRDSVEEGEDAVGYEATSDEKGVFRFYELDPGDWKVLIEPPGYFPVRTKEDIGQNEAIDVTYYVERGEYNPYDVMVSAPKPRKEVSRTVVSAAEIDKIPGTAGDPLGVIQNLAGVARAPAFSGEVIVRGSAPQDSRIFVDGMEVPIIYHFGGIRSVLPIGIVDSIEFYPGNFSPRYGRATGGVIDATIKKLEFEKVGGYADLSILDAGLLLEVPFGDKGGMVVAGRRSHVDAVIDAFVPESANVNMVAAPRYYDYQILANYRPTPAHDLRAMIFGSDDQLEMLFGSPADIDPALAGGQLSTSTTFFRSTVSHRYVPNQKFENEIRIAHGKDWVNLNLGQFLFDADITTTQIRDTVTHNFSDRVSLNYGLDVLLLSADASIRAPMAPREGQPLTGLELDDTRTTELSGEAFWSPASFVELDWEILPRLRILPGVRVDYFQRVGQTAAQPRLTTRWQFADQWTAKAAIGSYAQEPTFDATDENFGNPDLRAEQSLHYAAGFEFQPEPYITLDVTGFYKDLWSLTSLTDNLVGEDENLRPQMFDNEGRGRVYGMELMARHDFSNNFSGWLAYTLSRSLRRDSGVDAYRRFDFDQTHILTAIASYALPRNWQIGSRFRLVSGNPLTPITASTFHADADRYVPVYGAINSRRVAPFHQLDLRIDKRWIYQDWMLNVYLDIQNVYNRVNPEGLAYNFNFSESQPQQGLPMLAIFGVRAEF